MGLGWRGRVWRSPDSLLLVYPGLPDSPGELHRAVTGRGAAPQGVEGSGHAAVPGEAPPHPPSRVFKPQHCCSLPVFPLVSLNN